MFTALGYTFILMSTYCPNCRHSSRSLQTEIWLLGDMQSWRELLVHGKPQQTSEKQTSHHHEAEKFGGMKVS